MLVTPPQQVEQPRINNDMYKDMYVKVWYVRGSVVLEGFIFPHPYHEQMHRVRLNVSDHSPSLSSSQHRSSVSRFNAVCRVADQSAEC